MKKILSILTISLSALVASGLTSAAPHHDEDREFKNPRTMHANNKHEQRAKPNDDQRFEKRRMREERGVKRLQELRWQAGYVLPQHYRGNGYKIDHDDNNLPKPSRNEQWYKINNNYILVNTESNTIIRISDH